MLDKKSQYQNRVTMIMMQKNRKLSNRDIANLTGYTIGYVRNILNGNKPLSHNFLTKYMKVIPQQPYTPIEKCDASINGYQALALFCVCMMIIVSILGAIFNG